MVDRSDSDDGGGGSCSVLSCPHCFLLLSTSSSHWPVRLQVLARGGKGGVKALATFVCSGHGLVCVLSSIFVIVLYP